MTRLLSHRDLLIRFATICLMIVTFLVKHDPAVADSPKKPTMRIEKDEDTAAWNVYSGESLFAGYVADSGGKPIIYPIHGPGGHPMTRNFPMRKNYGTENGDHDHQRSMWFTHGDINGVDFWTDDEASGKIVQRDIATEITEKGSAVVTTQNDWMTPDKKKRLLSDTRRVEFTSHGPRRRTIDFDILLRATDGDVNFGDTKEGSFGMRIASTMKVSAKKGGIITNEKLDTDKDAWGKPSKWVDYSGPVNDELVGITIHNHPSSFGFPSRWHVRTYGLFAANPFGRYHFIGGKKQDGIVLLKDKTMRLNYRIVLYMDEFDPKVAEADSEQYHNDPRPVIE